MTWTVSATRTRPAKATHTEWVPSTGQRAAVEALCSKSRVALWADPGAGKTSIMLAAFLEMRAAGKARTMLVVAPLRVCQLQWRQEAHQWTQFRGLKVLFLHGPKKEEILRESADIYLINFDGLSWLAKQFRGGLPFDIVCLDESTKIKNHQAQRSKALRACTLSTPVKVMLTGTPSPNGYLDLFSQFLWLDGGQALGKFVTHFREKFFNKAFNGFDYDLQKGGGERIEQRIAHLVHRLPFTDLPPLVNDVRWCEFSPEGKKLYRTMDKEQVIKIGDLVISAGSTGAHQSAKEQMANGAIYKAAGEEEYVAFDDAKLDALDELIEEMNGQPLLVAFQFHHDIERIRARRGKDVAVLAGGVTAKVAEEIQRAWNAGEIKELYVHPASIGHGLNLQRGGASHVCWFSATFDLELWEQLIRRLWRQGNTASRIVNHILAMKGTIDEDKLEAMEDKSVDQARLLQSMENQSAQPREQEIHMTERLGFQAGNAPAPTGWGPPSTTAPAPAAGGWGAPAAPAQGGWGAPSPTPPPAAPSPVQQGWGAPAPQQNIQHGGERIDPSQSAMQHFSPEVQQAVAALPPAAVAAETPLAPAEAEKPKRAARAKTIDNTVIAVAEPAATAALSARAEHPHADPPVHQEAYIEVRVNGNADQIKAAFRKLAGL